MYCLSGSNAFGSPSAVDVYADPTVGDSTDRASVRLALDLDPLAYRGTSGNETSGVFVVV